MTAPVRMALSAETRQSVLCWSRPQRHRRVAISGPAGRGWRPAGIAASHNAVVPPIRPGLLMKIIFSKVPCMAAAEGAPPRLMRLYPKAKMGRVITDGASVSGTGAGCGGMSRGLPSTSTVSLCNANFRRIGLGETT
ncbi:hypothetical protein MSG_00481 [Mycobacterium shigaense]|uniref:Uncharacterized protein n=1 Tax=Mycobacterium shigaense TaxID=722731 RepID=A0A1Z4ECH1_9MYCO|nr:hypothetical protein MSG_00481 [Mycobacterium shigaense]